MQADKLEWVIVNGIFAQKGREVGAIAYLNGEIVAITAFHAANDFNQDGKVTMRERIRSFLPLVGNENQVMASVVSAAYSDPDILVRGGGLQQMRGKAITSLGYSLIAEGGLSDLLPHARVHSVRRHGEKDHLWYGQADDRETGFLDPVQKRL